MITKKDLEFLRRCVELAAEAVESGDSPFGSILVSENGKILAEEKNETVSTGDETRHPEFELARWAALNLSPEKRASATVYTSGEHCPMCSAAHGWVGLGRIVYASSSKQLREWMKEFKIEPSPVSSIPIQEVVPSIQVDGPALELAEEIKSLHLKASGKSD